MGEPPSLRFVFETSERIEINLLEEKAAMGFLKHEEKPPEKVKVTKASLPSHIANTNATCFKCGKAWHLQKDCKEGKTTTSQSGGFYSGCGIKGHNEAKCWKLHPELKPTGNKGTKASGSKKDKETKASTGEKKGWKAKFVELEAKMATMTATTTSGGAKPQVIPSFHAGRRICARWRGVWRLHDEWYGIHCGGLDIGSLCKHSEPNGGIKGYSTRNKLEPGSTVWWRQPTSSITGVIHIGRNGANNVYGLSFEGGSFFK
jgi:hypothetical protein